MSPLKTALRRLLIAVPLFAIFANLPAQADEKPRVVVSIQPLALLVSEVAGDMVELSTLVESGQSPHSFQLRPSGRRSLAEADLIVWVGPSLELFLQKLMSQEALRNKALALGPNPDADVVASPDEHDHGPVAELGEGVHEEPGHGHAHDEGSEDPHIWLDPAFALSMAQSIAATLKQSTGIDKAQVDRNLEAFESRLDKVDRKIRQRFANARPVSIFTYHEAFGRFAEHYGLDIAGSLTFSPEVQPGAQRLSRVLERLRSAESPCILTEPQFDRQWWRSVTDGIDVTISSWDPLATGIAAEPGGYTQFLEGLADAALRCSDA
ncbi:MAG: ABC transporter substrate-binding protein [Alteromonadaceae bacterium]|nr:ABC transporter substrate-binding protein [Alteromonadaceae bacterium]|tara:strand:- start:1129 stop:2097 length:969 start_codon:yes stop_codon:yes gene_type:complete